MCACRTEKKNVLIALSIKVTNLYCFLNSPSLIYHVEICGLPLIHVIFEFTFHLLNIHLLLLIYMDMYSTNKTMYI